MQWLWNLKYGWYNNIGYIYIVGGKRQTTSVSLKCYECVFIGCSVYSVDSRDVFVFFMDC